MTNPNNLLMVNTMLPEVSNYHNSRQSGYKLFPKDDYPANLLEEYVFNNSYHSPLDLLLETYCPLDFQLSFDICPDIIPCAKQFRTDKPDEYARLESLHKRGRTATILYVIHIIQQEHPNFYMDWQDSGMSFKDYAKEHPLCDSK